jgi:hypothetical protein
LAAAERDARISSTLIKKAPDAVWKASRMAVPEGMTNRIASVAESCPKCWTLHELTA